MALCHAGTPQGAIKMQIIRKSMLTKEVNTREVPVDPDKYANYGARRLRGTAGLIQDEFPELSKDDREFILTGVTPEEWAKTFPPEEN
jgi:hypothetical protein